MSTMLNISKCKHVHAYMHICIHAHAYMHMHTCTCIHVHAYMHIWIHAHAYMYMHTCINVFNWNSLANCTSLNQEYSRDIHHKMSRFTMHTCTHTNPTKVTFLTAHVTTPTPHTYCISQHTTIRIQQKHTNRKCLDHKFHGP